MPKRKPAFSHERDAYRKDGQGWSLAMPYLGGLQKINEPGVPSHRA